MHIASFVIHDSFPLLPSGKVDRQALQTHMPASEALKTASTSFAIAHGLAEICANVLRLPEVGLHDDFFDLGGTSLGLIRVLSSANARFGTNVDISVVSKGATISALALAFERALPSK
jgi:hypothetical protein